MNFKETIADIQDAWACLDYSTKAAVVCAVGMVLCLGMALVKKLV